MEFKSRECDKGPVVQNIFSLTKALVKNLLRKDLLGKDLLSHLGLVVQSIVSLTNSLSLTSSLRGQLLKHFTLYYKINFFLLKRREKLLHCKSLSHFFSKKSWQILMKR